METNIMNKKPKFRAWYKPDFNTPDGPLMFAQKEINDEIFFVCVKDEEIRYPLFAPFIDDDWIVEQFTGISDKNGKDVYGGDIVRMIYEEQVGQVYYDYNFGGYRITTKAGISYPVCTVRTKVKEEGFECLETIRVADEVIGNVCENLELLK